MMAQPCIFVNLLTRKPRLNAIFTHTSIRDAAGNLVFRYDNADHHRKLNLATHPHHKHDGNEANIVAATVPTLADVLAEIEQVL